MQGPGQTRRTRPISLKQVESHALRALRTDAR